MPPVGPQMQPSIVEKRKRNDCDNSENGSTSSSDSETGPLPPPGEATESVAKKPRVIGPSLPPKIAPSMQEDRDFKYSDDENENSDNDDEFGPSLPPKDGSASKPSTSSPAVGSNPQTAISSASAPKRDDWMMVPPSSGDWTGRVDPTKLKNRKFNTGKSAKGPSTISGGATDSWHETPQEKQARLQREMMGIKDTSTQSKLLPHQSADSKDEETAKRMKEYNKSRGPSLYEAHQKGQTAEQDDDPGARAFDREKDIGGGLQINASQRRDMMKKAGDFSSKFSSAKYL